jgi:hypothetical protein
LQDIIRQAGFKTSQSGPALAISGKLVVPLELEYKACSIRAVITLTFHHQNIITCATYHINDIVYSHIEELVIEDFQKELEQMLSAMCGTLGQACIFD